MTSRYSPLPSWLARLRTRKVSPVEVLQAHLDRIEEINPQLNAIVTLAPDVMQRAKEAEAAVMRGDALGPLHGVPVTIKDTIETAGLRTTSGSQCAPSLCRNTDAPAVARLKAAGAIILGKTNTAEMAMDYTADNPVFGRTINPHDPSLTTGRIEWRRSCGDRHLHVSGRNRQRPRGLGSNSSSLLRHRWFEADGWAHAGRGSVSTEHWTIFAWGGDWADGAVRQ